MLIQKGLYEFLNLVFSHVRGTGLWKAVSAGLVIHHSASDIDNIIRDIGWIVSIVR